ncbi:MAG: gliding motility protein GldC [Crocinitomicaceae bacterium]|jgi:gliding motility-associated protein GldC|nr:gliding motility protein GldC [Crocinitomicaceae bacterium]
MEEENKIVKTSTIQVHVGTNVNNVPVRMLWSADDGGVENQEAGAMLLSFWDPKDKNTLKVDLWTKDLTIEEMKQFFHQTLVTMADTFEKATGEKNISEDLRDYCYHFAEKMDILPE